MRVLGGVGQHSHVVLLAGSAEARGQKETHRDGEERGARCAAKVPGVIDVMTVYPSCCVATA